MNPFIKHQINALPEQSEAAVGADDLSDVDQWLEYYLRAELEGQLGRAEMRFRSRLSTRQSIHWRGPLLAAMVACLALAGGVALNVERHGKMATAPPTRIADPTVHFMVTPPTARDHTIIFSQITDGGVVDVTGQPVQLFHRDLIEQTSYYDEATRSVAQENSPRQQVILIALQEF